MRVAIFDGILESHVGSSLERAFKTRGHETLNTGKIGNGFRFPSSKDDTAHLEYAVSRVLSFNPDLVFVMRPASLPFRLLAKLRKSGAAMMAWFSDDPVLFDLSYGPVVDLYDFILHCGSHKVLSFYEERFGRPTGINFPFWTDHEAFPRVWGSEDPDTSFLFLGNVQDEVRRKRYFELSELEGGVRIHGNIGADYFGLSGGYLDNDAEVVAAGSRTRLALNIPQFFENHRKLDTWFEGLGDLGFFEYPSRVVQYMAMGIPTISVIPGEEGFRSYPEMLVANSIPAAGEIAEALMQQGKLEALSSAVSSRFDRNFCADARVLAIEELLRNDEWKSLDTREREIWFTRFDATEATAGQVEAFRESSQANANPALGIAVAKDNLNVEPTEEIPHVVLLGSGSGTATSRLSAVASAFRTMAVDTRAVDVDLHEKFVVKDPSGICELAVNAARVIDLIGRAPRTAVIVVCGVNAALTADGVQRFREAGYRTAIIDDVGPCNARQTLRLLQGYNLVATSSLKTFRNAHDRGFSNIRFLPHFVDPDFLKALQEIDLPKSKVIHVRKDALTEESVCPAMVQDLPAGASDIPLNFSDLRDKSLKELAEYLSSEIALMSYDGSRSNPRLNEVMPYVAVSCDWLFFSRNAVHELIHPYEEMSSMVFEVGELAIKAASLSSSRETRTAVRNSKTRALETLEAAPRHLLSSLIELGRQTPETLPNFPLEKGTIVPLELDEPFSEISSNTAILRLEVLSWVGELSDWWLRVRVDGQAAYGRALSQEMDVAITSSRKVGKIQLECEYLGPEVRVSSYSSLRVSTEVLVQRSAVNGHVPSSAAMRVI